MAKRDAKRRTRPSVTARPHRESESLLPNDRLTFDGYKLRWHGDSPASYDAFSGRSDESANESVIDQGPTPQGRYTVDPADIQDMPRQHHVAWGRKRVVLEPLRATRERILDCLKVDRKGFYIHGGTEPGTLGCIEINDERQHAAFFDKLARYGRKIDVEVLYVGARERKYEDPRCPYPLAAGEGTNVLVTEQLQRVVQTAIGALTESRGSDRLFPDGLKVLEVRVSAAGMEISLRAAGNVRELDAPQWMATGLALARTPMDAAKEILKSDKIELLDSHSSGNVDDATALDNVTDTSKGKDAKRSEYGTAPGGTVALSLSMLDGMLSLAETYSMGISEVAGGEHSKNSRHYAGVAFDVYSINGKKVNKDHPDVKAFRAAATAAGATEVLGPGDANHDTHVHAAWPRPKAMGAISEESYCEAPV